MGKFQYFTAVSLDGFIATGTDSLDWLLNAEETGTEGRIEEFYAGVGCLVMGGTTYQWILDHFEGEWPYSGTPVWVFTHHEMPVYPGGDVTLIRGDVEEFVPDFLRDAGDKDVWVMGGGELAAQFAAAGHLDELILTVMPVILGSGKRILPLAGGPRQLELLESAAVGNVLELRYVLKPSS
ncbi:dihydrofolate reductase family protein [Arthrobacter woluwensis]|uniref:dihydrofolate reductase family protein n=1 Tax=Arthrobacter woluwensis TaxID=156980 RepID=UPI0011A88F78|nr:dihydrofolate reductase family protein [Arthrobacter woluwensis]